MIKLHKTHCWIPAVLQVAIAASLSFAAGAQPRFTAPTNEAALAQRMDVLRQHYAPYLQSLPKQPPFSRPPVRSDGWFRGLPSETLLDAMKEVNLRTFGIIRHFDRTDPR